MEKVNVFCFSGCKVCVMFSKILMKGKIGINKILKVRWNGKEMMFFYNVLVKCLKRKLKLVSVWYEILFIKMLLILIRKVMVL